jgi:uncharacterized protein YchJ
MMKLFLSSLWLLPLKYAEVAAAKDLADYALLGDSCTRQWHAQQIYYADLGGNSAAAKKATCFPDEIYDDVTEKKYHLTCDIAENDTGFDGQNGIVEVTGTCQRTACTGTNDILEITKDRPALGTDTHRVTICHRTCSNTINPWVRITIDKDAWENPEDHCGSDDQHNNTTQKENTGHWMATCADESEGESFVIRDHGSLSYVSSQFDANNSTVTANGTFVSEKDYWHYWERACPYVRQTPDSPNPCCGINGDFSDCCGDIKSYTSPPSSSPTSKASEIPSARLTEESIFNAMTARELQDSDCPSDISDPFQKVIYLTFMGSQSGITLVQALNAAGTTKTVLENELRNQYNTLGGDGNCVYYNRKITSVVLNDAVQVPAFNKDYEFVGFRVSATVSGLCNNCSQHALLPTELCAVTQDSYCTTCQELSNNSLGKIIQISGSLLFQSINQALNLVSTSAEIFRIQSDVNDPVPETPICGNGETRYVKPTGQASCL